MDLICGMHRSGTSLVARVAYEVGADFGDPTGFHPADRWNPDGYFEQREILDVNRHLVNGPWGRVAYLRLPTERTICRRASNISEQLATLATKYRDKAVKENRFCLTLGTWRAHGAAVEKLLIVYRDPSSVARSLGKRNRIPRFLALRLWAEHYRRLLRTAQDIPAACLSYDRMVADEAGAAGEADKIGWLLGADSKNVVEAMRRFARFGGRSQREIEANLTPQIRRLYEHLRQRNQETP